MAVGTTLDSGGTLDHWCEWDIGKEADGWHAVFNYHFSPPSTATLQGLCTSTQCSTTLLTTVPTFDWPSASLLLSTLPPWPLYSGSTAT